MPAQNRSHVSTPAEMEDHMQQLKQHGFIVVKMSDVQKEVQCLICLGIIRKTRTVMECMHRFCRECIDKAMRLGKHECPACRTHCASHRSLRDDPNYDAIITALFPDLYKYEEEESAFHHEQKAHTKQKQASIAQTLVQQSDALGRKRTVRARTTAFRSSNHRFTKRKRNHRATECQGSDEKGDNENGGKVCSADKHSPRSKTKKHKRQGGVRISETAEGTNAEAGFDENNLELIQEPFDASAGHASSSETHSWGNSGLRSHTRYGGLSGDSSRFTQKTQTSKQLNKKDGRGAETIRVSEVSTVEKMSLLLDQKLKSLRSHFFELLESNLPDMERVAKDVCTLQSKVDKIQATSSHLCEQGVSPIACSKWESRRPGKTIARNRLGPEGLLLA